MRSDGLQPQPVEREEVGGTELGIFLNEIGANPIDSALVVKHGGHAVVNMNDNPFDRAQIDAILDFVGDDEIRIALLPFTGAGPYPQTYYDDEAVLAAKAEEKKQQFFRRYEELRDALKPAVSIPFAGQYLLGGRLAALNAHRGVADAAEVLSFDPRAVVLADAGSGRIASDTLDATATRTAPYPEAMIRDRVAAIRTEPLAYETELAGLAADRLPLRRLLPLAYAHAIERSPCEASYLFCFDASGFGDGYFVCDAHRKTGFCEWRDVAPAGEPRSELRVDPRYLFGLLTGLYHWNNAEVGSHLRVRRVPDRHVPEAQDFLNFFHV